MVYCRRYAGQSLQAVAAETLSMHQNLTLKPHTLYAQHSMACHWHAMQCCGAWQRWRKLTEIIGLAQLRV